MRDRRQIAGYVTPNDFDRIQQMAERRAVSVASLVSRATLWLVRYLEVEELGPQLEVGVRSPPHDQAEVAEVAAPPARWKFQREEQRTLRHRPSATAPVTAERRVRKKRSNADET